MIVSPKTMRGKIDFVNRVGQTITVGYDYFSYSKIPVNKRNFKVGDIVILTIESPNKYYLTDIELETPDKKEDKQMKADELKKLKEEYEKSMSKMTDGQKEVLHKNYLVAINAVTEVYKVSATYDDSKKDIEDVVELLSDAALILSIEIDKKTYGYL